MAFGARNRSRGDHDRARQSSRSAAVLAALSLGGLVLAAVASAHSATTTYPPAQVAAGKSVFLSAGCGKCHVLVQANSHGAVGPNLNSIKPAYSLIVSQVTNGGRFMPPFGAVQGGPLSTIQINNVAAFIYTSEHPSTKPAPTPTQHITVTIGSPKAASCTLSRTLVPKATVIFTILNKGVASLVFEIAGKTTPQIRPQTTATLTVDLSKVGHYTYSCAVNGVLTVT